LPANRSRPILHELPATRKPPPSGGIIPWTAPRRDHYARPKSTLVRMEGADMDGLPLPQQIARMDADRLRRYRENLDFYHGRQWTGTPRRRERRLTFNYARAIVDKVTSYLLTGLDFAVDPPEQGDAGRVLAARTEG